MDKDNTIYNYVGRAKDKPDLGPVALTIVENLKATGKYKDYRWTKVPVGE